jgi:hypothetical protein
MSTVFLHLLIWLSIPDDAPSDASLHMVGSVRLFFGIVDLQSAYYFNSPVIVRESFEGNIDRSVSECFKLRCGIKWA